jgi:hypothetical protein
MFVIGCARPQVVDEEEEIMEEEREAVEERFTSGRYLGLSVVMAMLVLIAIGVHIGLGRIIAFYYRSSTLHQIH